MNFNLTLRIVKKKRYDNNSNLIISNYKDHNIAAVIFACLKFGCFSVYTFEKKMDNSRD